MLWCIWCSIINWAPNRPQQVLPKTPCAWSPIVAEMPPLIVNQTVTHGNPSATDMPNKQLMLPLLTIIKNFGEKHLISISRPPAKSQARASGLGSQVGDRTRLTWFVIQTANAEAEKDKNLYSALLSWALFGKPTKYTSRMSTVPQIDLSKKVVCQFLQLLVNFFI